eukprot:1684352-Rhodomonas_salina.1
MLYTGHIQSSEPGWMSAVDAGNDRLADYLDSPHSSSPTSCSSSHVWNKEASCVILRPRASPGAGTNCARNQ